MNNEFKKLSQGNITRYVLESASGGGTSSGSVASVSMPMGGTRKRGDNLIAQEADKNTVPASTPRNFVAKNAKTAGAGAHKDKSKTIPRKEKHKKPYMEDHSTASGGWGHSSYDTYTAGNHGRGVAENPEWYSDEANSMSSSQLKSLYKHAMKLRQTVKQMQAQGDTLEPWQQSKVTKAADYLDAVFNAVDDEHDMGEEQDMAETMDMPPSYDQMSHEVGTNAPIIQQAPSQAMPDMAKMAQIQTKDRSMASTNPEYAKERDELKVQLARGIGPSSMKFNWENYYLPISQLLKKYEGVKEGKIDFAKKLQGKVDKHNKAAVKTKKEIGSRVVDIGAGGKEHNEKTDAAWDAAKKKVAEGYSKKK